MCGSPASPLLLVEDGPLALLSAQAALEEAGHRVIAARHGMSALLALDQPLSAIITDIRLPGPFDGWQLARKAREAWPGIPVIYVSGDGMGWSQQGVPGSVLLQKPFASALLIRALADLMRQSGGRPDGDSRRDDVDRLVRGFATGGPG
ncbi:MAG TPA: response regulator [Sphingomonas sp.]|nr:response regulator [Sphingomonas sp.]